MEREWAFEKVVLGQERYVVLDNRKLTRVNYEYLGRIYKTFFYKGNYYLENPLDFEMNWTRLCLELAGSELREEHRKVISLVRLNYIFLGFPPLKEEIRIIWGINYLRMEELFPGGYATACRCSGLPPGKTFL